MSQRHQQPTVTKVAAVIICEYLCDNKLRQETAIVLQPRDMRLRSPFYNDEDTDRERQPSNLT
jgi:hypothetical protein